jgi:hypothetical protein
MVENFCAEVFIRLNWPVSVLTVKNLELHKGREFLDQLINYQLRENTVRLGFGSKSQCYVLKYSCR